MAGVTIQELGLRFVDACMRLLLAAYAVLQAFLGGVPIDEAHIEPLLETSCISAYQDISLQNL